MPKMSLRMSAGMVNCSVAGTRSSTRFSADALSRIETPKSPVKIDLI